MNMKRLFFLLAIPLVLTGCISSNIGRTVSFERPDIKDDFCGVHINFQYCKCAFHNEFCDAIGMSKKEANAHVQSQYELWIDGLLATFGTQCVAEGGYMDDEECAYCKDSFVAQDGACVPEEEAVVKLPDGPYNDDCSLKQDEFDRDWKKYSDIDEVIPFEDRSYEAKQALVVYETMIAKMIEAFEIDRDVEIERQALQELEAYKTALVQNIKTNLLKAFWRLAWVTYQTVDSGKSLGQSYSKVLTEGASAETVGAGLKVIQGIIPSTSSLAIDTSTITGKVKATGASVALEAIDSLGDPVAIATELFKSSTNATLPSADISDEEVAILKEQHITNGVIDEAIAESTADIATGEARMSVLEQEIATLQTEIDSWETKEKDRVSFELVESCKTLTGRE